jgi:site-specific DNA-cytosine methylase
MRIVDLNCRGGGFLLGFKEAGHDAMFACDDSPAARDMATGNLGVQAAPMSIDPSRIPHPDVACAASHGLDVARFCYVVSAIGPRVVAIEFSGSSKPFGVKGYRWFVQSIRAADFGTPMAGFRRYAVGFRDDVDTNFISFPFPEGPMSRRCLGDILEAGPAPELAIQQSTMESIRSRNDRNAAMGTRFRHRVLSPSDLCPSLLRYHKDGYDAIVDVGHGPRRMSTVEIRRAMGFPDSWKVPESRTQACVLLSRSAWPAVAKSLAEEIATWLS